MNNTVTFETAKRLKDADFPQPKPEAGQLWYDPKEETLFFVIEVSGGAVYWVTVGEYGDEGKFQVKEIKLFVFAPTATDILRELEYSDLTFRKGKFRFIFEHIHAFSESPHEAAALAFLSAKGGEK